MISISSSNYSVAKKKKHLMVGEMNLKAVFSPRCLIYVPALVLQKRVQVQLPVGKVKQTKLGPGERQEATSANRDKYETH